jgi:hypothetical protein
MPVRDSESLRELARSRTKTPDFFHAATLFHQLQALPGLEGANQNEAAAFPAFDEQVEHPVDTVVKINVNRAGPITLDKRPGARPGKGVASFVIQGQIRLCLDDNAGAFSPDQPGADKLARADQGIALEK